MPDLTNTTAVNFEEIRALQDFCFMLSEMSGFHAEGDRLRAFTTHPTDVQALRNYYGNKLMLIVGEAAEAHEELRAGHDMTETYYPTYPAPGTAVTGELRRYKPEGVPSELADIVIRVFDLAGEAGIDLATMIEKKLAFNSTREKMHGKKF